MGETALDDPEIKNRARTAWRATELELGKVLDFEGRHMSISRFEQQSSEHRRFSPTRFPWRPACPLFDDC